MSWDEEMRSFWSSKNGPLKELAIRLNEVSATEAAVERTFSKLESV
jgi:hypothetical protein